MALSSVSTTLASKEYWPSRPHLQYLMAATPSDGDPPQYKSLKVLHVLRSPLGGLFRHVKDLAHGQSQHGLQVGIACDTLTGGTFAGDVLHALRADCRLGIYRIPISRKPGWSDLKVAAQLIRLCKKRSPHIIHGHGAKGGAYARILASRSGARAVCTPHGGSLHYTSASLSGALYLSLERMLKHRTNGMIFESEYARQAYLEKVGGMSFPSRVIHNGLYDSEFAALTQDACGYDFVFVGEIRKLKGIDVLLDAVSMARQHRRVTLLMAGSGPDEIRLQNRINQLGLREAITLSPPMYPATKALAKGACIVAPSLAESLPYLVLETLAAGVPMLTTRVGGIPEIFGPYAHQLLPPGDVESLAQAMLKVLDDPVAAQRDAQTLRRHVKSHLRVTQMVQATIEFYEQITGIQKRTARQPDHIAV